MITHTGTVQAYRHCVNGLLTSIVWTLTGRLYDVYITDIVYLLDVLVVIVYMSYCNCWDYLLCQGEWTRNSRFVAPNLRGAIAPSRFGCDESTCFASILRLKMHSDMQLTLLFLLLIQMHINMWRHIVFNVYRLKRTFYHLKSTHF